MSARTQRHQIDLPPGWPAVVGLLSSYFLVSGVLGVTLGRGVALSLDGLVPTVISATLTTGVFTTAAGIALARARVLITLASLCRS
jgi:hypothetical protein